MSDEKIFKMKRVTNENLDEVMKEMFPDKDLLNQCHENIRIESDIEKVIAEYLLCEFRDVPGFDFFNVCDCCGDVYFKNRNGEYVTLNKSLYKVEKMGREGTQIFIPEFQKRGIM